MSLFIITWVFDAGIIPQYIIYNQFGFVNSPWVMIVPGAINTQFLIITKTFLEGIPNELEEAAVVDGANDIKILTRVFLPLSPLCWRPQVCSTQYPSGTNTLSRRFI